MLEALQRLPLEDLFPALLDRDFRDQNFLFQGDFGSFPAHQQKVVVMSAEEDDVRRLPEDGEPVAAEQVLRREAGKAGLIDLHRLGKAGEVDQDQDGLFFIATHEGQNLVVVVGKEFDAPPAEGLELPAQGDHPPHPPQQRRRVACLGLHTDRFIMIFRIDDDRQEEPLRVAHGKAGIAVRAPLHRGAHPVPIPQVVVVPHAEFVAVVDDRRPREGKEEDVHQLDLPPVIPHERRQPAPDAEVDPGAGVPGIDAVHVVALLVGHHLQGQLVVVAQEEPPLAALGYRRGLLENIDDGEAVFHLQRHEHARHQGEMEGHVTGVTLAEVADGILRPLVRFGQQEPVGVVGVDMRP